MNLDNSPWLQFSYRNIINRRWNASAQLEFSHSRICTQIGLNREYSSVASAAIVNVTINAKIEHV